MKFPFFTLQELQAARSLAASWDVVSNQVEYNLFQRNIEHDIVPYCQENQVTVMAYSPLDRGLALQDGPRLKLLRSLATKYEKTVAQITLRWVISRPSIIAVVKSASREHTLENAQVMEFDLLDEDIDQIDKLFEQKIVHVPPARIRTKRPGAEGFYGSVDEALRNRDDLIPSPESLAMNIEKAGFPKPVPVIPSSDTSGAYDYDLVDNHVLYWAWVITKGMDEPIPAFEKRA
ncbi:MAG: aldo/keto reductase [Nitrospinae bacterium]|nr:aldo/keto reductase [Nitrospinota bacterium]